MRVLQVERDGQVGEYCGQCGKPIIDIPRYGIGWRELPYLFFGEWISNGKGADIIKAGEILIVPLCSPACRAAYNRKMKEVTLCQTISI
jgi:hypothetical protein